MEEFSALDRFFSKEIAGIENIALQKLMKSAREGHLCLPLVKIEKEKIDLEKFSDFICSENGNLYLKKNYILETIIKEEILRLSKPSKTSFSLQNSSCLNKEQAEAVQTCLENRLTFLNGGPGTGKTYTAAAIVASFAPKQEKRIALAAPTGRAADHLQASIDKYLGLKFPSSTLHKLLRVGSFPPWPRERFSLDLDLLIIDEASMIDAPLFATLLKAIPDYCTTIFMGDPNQLSPVGIGNIFHDLVTSSRINVVQAGLKQSMRTENEEILQMARQVLKGELPEAAILPSSQPYIPYKMSESADPEEILQSLSNYRTLNCLRVGPQGADAFNEKALKQKIAATPKDQWWWAPIMITGNDEELNLRNGELGIYMEKKDRQGSGFTYFSKAKGKIPLYALPKFEWSFCSSVHKSQGSEYEEVVILVPPGSEIFGRQMLYTAITRAKSQIQIVGDRQTIQAMLEKSLVKHSGFL